MVERCGGQVHRSRSHAGRCHAHGDLDGSGVAVAEGGRRQGFSDTFGLARRARGIEHLPPLGFVVDRRGQVPGGQRLVGVEVVERSSHDQAGGHPAQIEMGDHLGHGRRGHEGGGPAVVEDVLDLVAAQMIVESRVVEPGALGAPCQLEVVDVVLHEERHMTARRRAPVPQEVGEPVGALVDLAVRQRLSGARHDDGRGLRMPAGLAAEVEREVRIRGHDVQPRDSGGRRRHRGDRRGGNRRRCRWSSRRHDRIGS